MNKENIPSVESGREKLLELEKSGKYVFHGSRSDLEKLEPKQAYNDNEDTCEREADGDPAVFATPYADVAIFRALTSFDDSIGETNSRFGMNEEGVFFEATQNLLELAKRKTGKVYVIKKENFINFKGMECRNSNAVFPIEVIDVVFSDLPKNIKVT